MKAVILAAGLGYRLKPLTETRPKPMLEIAGKPLLQYVIESLRENQIKDILIVVGYKREVIEDYFEFGDKFNVKIDYVLQEEALGVEDAILKTEEKMKNEEQFLVVHADVLADPELIGRTIKTFKNLDADATISATLVENPQFYGVVVFSEDSKLEYIVEKPKPGESPSNYAVAGVYVFKNIIFDFLRSEKTLDAAIRKLSQKGDVYVSVWEKEWVEIRYPWDILRANRLVLSKMLKGKGSFIAETASIDNGAKIEGPVWISNNVKIRSGSTIKGPCYIGENSYIGNNALIREYVSIGRDVIVGFGVELKNSVIFNGTKIGRLSFIGDSILGENVDVGAGTQTWNVSPRSEPIYMNIEEEKVRVPMEKFGAVIGDNTQISINASILPGKIIGTNVDISPGVIVDRDVPSNTEVYAKQEIVIKSKR